MRVSRMCTLTVCTFFALFGIAALAAPPASGYHLLKKVPLGKAAGGAEYFDYITVDAEARRIYVSHGSEFKILDADNFSVVGTISGLKRCHGVALVPELGKGFITDGDAASVVVFTLSTGGHAKPVQGSSHRHSVEGKMRSGRSGVALSFPRAASKASGRNSPCLPG